MDYNCVLSIGTLIEKYLESGHCTWKIDNGLEGQT
jgi:hypothetical protein